MSDEDNRQQLLQHTTTMGTIILESMPDAEGGDFGFILLTIRGKNVASATNMPPEQSRLLASHWALGVVLDDDEDKVIQ